jgi:hypothetical protein
MVWTVVSPGSSGLAIPANKVSPKVPNWEIIMINAMRLTLSNNVDGSGSGKCGWYRSSVGSVGAGGDVRLQGPFLVIGVGIGEDRPLVVRTGHDGLQSWLGSVVIAGALLRCFNTSVGSQ